MGGRWGTGIILVVISFLDVPVAHGQSGCTSQDQVSPSLRIKEVHFQINDGEPVLAKNEEILQLEAGDLLTVTEITFSSQGPAMRRDVASAEAVLRTDPSDKENFPAETFRGNDPSPRVRVTGGVQSLGGLLFDASRQNVGGWSLEPGTDRLVIALIHNFSFEDPGSGCSGGCGSKEQGCFEVDDRFFLNLQVGQPDFVIDDCSLQLRQGPSSDPVSGTPLLLGEPVKVSATVSNQRDGLFFIDAEADIFRLGDGEPVWVGVTSFLLLAGETLAVELVNTDEENGFPFHWRPEAPGTYLITVTVDPEKAKIETGGGRRNNFAVIGAEVLDPEETNPRPTDLSALADQLKLFETELEIRNSSPVLPLCNYQSVTFDGLPRSFSARGLAPVSCSDDNDPAFGAFRALVAFGRVFAFDAATEILEDIVSDDCETARGRLQILKDLFETCEDLVGDEVIVDSWNTVGDGFPFNSEEEEIFRRGTAGNVASVLQAFFAFQLACADRQFEAFATDRLDRLLAARRITAPPDSPAFGLIASRPSGTGNTFAIVENNLRMLDMLTLAHLATAVYTTERDELDAALRRVLDSSAPAAEVPEAVDVATGDVDNDFTAQDIYTIGGIYLLRRGLLERAWEFLTFTDTKFLVAHTPGEEEGRNLQPGSVEALDPGELPEGALVGLKFFEGNDDDGEGTSILIGEGPPVDFNDRGTISAQTEATLDYIFFLNEFAVLARAPDRREFAEVRRDQLIAEVLELFSFSQRGGLPVSTRSIPDLFETFDGSLPSAEARILARVMEDRSRLPFYRGANPPAGDDGCVVDDETLCLNQGRFRATTEWRTPQGTSGKGQAMKLTDDTGYFWFFDEDNVEMVIKVLDACGFADRYWVFAGGLTNVRVDTRVADTLKGGVKIYRNPLSTPFRPIQDTDAFATCP